MVVPQMMLAKRPPASVIIPAYNYGPFIAQALDAALAQEGWSLQLIVVDDGSTDNTAQVVASYGAAVEYVRLQNSGVAVARNVGLDRAKGELICFLDADDVWFPDKLTTQWEALQRSPGAGLVFSDAIRIRKDGTHIDLYSEKVPQYGGWVFDKIMRRNFIQTSMVMMPRDVLESVGGFDEALPAWEDIDLWCRVAARYPFAYVPRPLEYYRMHGGFHTATRRQAHGRLQSILKILATVPQSLAGPSLRRELIATGQIEVGLAYYLTDDMTTARRYLRQALATTPRAALLQNWLQVYARSLLGQGIIENLRTIMRRLPGHRAQGGSGWAVGARGLPHYGHRPTVDAPLAVSATAPTGQ